MTKPAKTDITGTERDQRVQHNEGRRERFAAQSRAELEKEAYKKPEFGVRKAPPGRFARLRRLMRK